MTALRKNYDAKWRAKNREHLRAYQARRRATPEYKRYNRDYHLRKKYGVSAAEFDQLLAEQGGRCASCCSPDPGHKNGWHLDHNHSTGEVRGILCCACNIAAGFIEDGARVEMIRSYLRRYQ